MSFSLSKDEAAVFPTELGGYPIDCDFRNILWILDVLADVNLSQTRRLLYALKYFYVDEVPENGVKLMSDFISQKKTDNEPNEEPTMDFEFDAEEIYSDFFREYNIDLFDVEMHWYKFLALLNGLSDNGALARKINVRTMDISGLKGKEKYNAQKAKERVKIPVKYTIEELAEIAEFEKWGE